MEVGTGLAVLGAAKLVEKLLGPTAEYLGAGLKSWSAKGVENMRRIVSVALTRLGDRIDEDGGVPPRVLKAVLQEGPFCDDQLACEYFGGVLASSRSLVARDDRGACLIALVGRMSTYQIRTHYILYRILKNLFDESGENLLGSERDFKAFIPMDAYVAAMGYSTDEDSTLLSTHALLGVQNAGLIRTYCVGDAKQQRREYLPGYGIVFTPAGPGAELYLWAHGSGDVKVLDFLRWREESTMGGQLNIPVGYAAVEEMAKQWYRPD